MSLIDSAVSAAKGNLPSLPSLPSLPTLPSLPSLPSLGSLMPSLPSLPSMPSLPSLPGLPGAGSAATGTWRTRLSKAAWRGMWFLTESHTESGGRRLVVHEFPGSDWPIVEDFGAKAPGFRLNAYFVGPQYDLARDKFLALLAKPGADWLMHPWRGLQWVVAKDWSLSESNEQGGYCLVVIDFVQGGVEPPRPKADAVDKAKSSLGALGDLAKAAFSLKSLATGALGGLMGVVQGGLASLSNLVAMASLPLAAISQVQNAVASFKGELGTLLALPGRYADGLQSLTNTFGHLDLSAADASSGGRATVAAVGKTVAAANKARQAAADPVAMIIDTGGGGVLSPATRDNVIAEATLRSRLMTVAACELALTDYTSAEARDTVLDTVLTALDVLLPEMPDEMFQSALVARAAMIEALMAQDVEPTQTREIVHAAPAVLLAHRLRVDEDAFIAQNAVRHPLFVQGGIRG